MINYIISVFIFFLILKILININLLKKLGIHKQLGINNRDIILVISALLIISTIFKKLGDYSYEHPIKFIYSNVSIFQERFF